MFSEIITISSDVNICMSMYFSAQILIFYPLIMFYEHVGGFESLKDVLCSCLTQPQNHPVEALLNTCNTFLPCLYLPLNLPISQILLRCSIWSWLSLLSLHLAPNLMDSPTSLSGILLLCIKFLGPPLPTDEMVLLLGKRATGMNSYLLLHRKRCWLTGSR